RRLADEPRPLGAVGAVAVGIGDLEIAMAIEAVALAQRRFTPAVDRDRTAVVHAHGPLRDVVVMGAPVGHLPSGMVLPPAEVVMAALRRVVDACGRAKPEIPVQTFGHRLGLERPFLRIVADAGFDALDHAEAAVADQFTGQAETGVRTLLAAGLKHAAG